MIEMWLMDGCRPPTYSADPSLFVGYVGDSIPSSSWHAPFGLRFSDFQTMLNFAPANPDILLTGQPRLIAGGDHALRHPVEGAEDSREDCIATLRALSPPLGPDDSVIGIASSGRTPWVLGGVGFAKSTGCFTAGIACASPSALRTEGNCEEVVECVVGGEVVTGSTRMKAGTATKLVCGVDTRAHRSIDTPYTGCRESSAMTF